MGVRTSEAADRRQQEMDVSRPDYRLLISPWSDQFANTLSQAGRELFISSPFVNVGGARALAEVTKHRSSIDLTLLTSLTAQNIMNGVTDPSALRMLFEQFGHVRISSLPRLHAKVYIVDGKVGIITSANLTSGGLSTNFEYGVQFDNAKIVTIIREDMNRYFSLGNIFTIETLRTIEKETKDLLSLRREAERAVRRSELATRLARASLKIEFELLQNRVKEGRTVNSILSETIVYILEKMGPLTTRELHEFIQPIHPDICDDSIDRVINGQYFGKRWKHLVRSAQQHLKQQGFIALSNGKWQVLKRSARS